MKVWESYIDESYNPRTFCVGGLLGSADMWSRVQAQWKARIDYENRISAKRGFPPISRYHATDCANLKKEFSPEHGWNVPRQISFSKRLTEIISNSGAAGFVCGGDMSDLRHHIRSDPNEAKKMLYYASASVYLIVTGMIMKEKLPQDRVTVYYDRSKQFGGIARQAFNVFMSDPTVEDLSRYFMTITPIGWEDCIPLQPADFMAYEGMKRLDSSRRGVQDIRKALQALLGNRMSLRIERFTDQNFQDIVRSIENARGGHPVEDGITSKMEICTGY